MERIRGPRGHLVVIASGAALLATSFLPLWATYRVPGLGLFAPETIHQNAWAAYGFSMQLALLLAAVAVAFTILLLVVRDADLPYKGLIPLGLSGAAALLMLWQVVTGPEGSSNPNGYGIDRGVLLFTGALLTGVMTYGGDLVRRDTGVTAGRRG